MGPATTAGSGAGGDGRRPDAAGTGEQAGARPAAAGRRWLALGVALALTVAFFFGVRAMLAKLGEAPVPGRPAPDFVLPQLDGPQVRLSELRGQVVVLNFWASWCLPCREETPTLEAFFRQYGDRVAFYAINVAEPVDKVREFIREFGVSYPVLLDRDKRVFRQYRVTGYPETYWIDADGILRVRWQGPMTLDDMRRLYQQTTGQPLDGAGNRPGESG